MKKTNGITVQPIAKLPTSLMPGSFDEIKSMADVFHASGLFQDIRSAAQAVIKVLKGREIGLPPLEAMTSINVIRGRISLSASAMAAVIKRSGKYRFTVDEHTDEICAIDFFERIDAQWELSGRSEFTMNDARRAEVANGESWKKYPRNMLYARALSNGARWYCPDVVSGMYTPEELGAEVDEDGQIAKGAQMVDQAEIVDPTRSLSVTEANIEHETADTAVPDEPQPEKQQPDDPRPEWLREAAQRLRDRITQSEVMELRKMWKEKRYTRTDLVERMRSLAARYKVEIDLPTDDDE